MQIFVTGFMGSGKSYWSGRWAQQYHYPLIDLDELIQQRAGVSIPALFESIGEAGFRQLETETLQQIDQPDCIIACGGGTPCFNNNMAWMNQKGITVYLKGTPKQLLQHLQKDDLSKRPLLANRPAAELLPWITDLLQQRSTCYQQAQLVIPLEAAHQQSLDHLFSTTHSNE